MLIYLNLYLFIYLTQDIDKLRVLNQTGIYRIKEKINGKNTSYYYATEAGQVPIAFNSGTVEYSSIGKIKC